MFDDIICTIDGEKLYQEIKDLFDQSLILPRGASTMLTLWCLATHGRDEVLFAAILLVSSPVKGCGKSTALEIVASLVYKTHFTGSITTAGIFRLLSEEKGTMILDEADTYFAGNNEMAGILNNIYKNNGAGVTRCDTSNGFTPVVFDAFGFVAIGMIGLPPDTVMSRSVPIRLKKKSASEEVKRFSGSNEHTDRLRDQCSEWMADQLEVLAGMEYPRLKSGQDRYDDNVEYLLAIAQLIGLEVYESAKLAALEIMDIVEDQDFGLVLLRDLREIFSQSDRVSFKTSSVLDKLKGLDESPWGEYLRGKPISARGLSDLLRPFDIM